MKDKAVKIGMALTCLAALSAEARVTRIVVTSQQSLAGGASFGSTGPYEKLKGTVYFEADPRNPHGGVVFDLDKAPRNGAGMVEFSADFVILSIAAEATRASTRPSGRRAP